METCFNEYMALSDNKKVILIINMILLIYFLLIYIILKTVEESVKMKNRLIWQEKSSKKRICRFI